LLHIKSVEDARQVNLPEEIKAVIVEQIETLVRIYSDEGGRTYDPELDGHLIVIETGDTKEEVKDAIGYSLVEAPLEGVVKVGQVFLSCVLWSNESGLTIAIIDHPDMDQTVRQTLESELIESDVGDG
jgi:hypothetical protein